MRQLHAGALAGSLGATTLVACVLIGLSVIGSEAPAAGDIVYLSSFLVMALAGGVLAGFRPRNAIAWIFSLGGTGTLLASLLAGIAGAGLLDATASSWLALISLELFGVGWVAVTALPLLLFPDGRPRGRLAKVGVAVTVVIAIVVAVCAATVAERGMGGPTSPLAVPEWGDAPARVLDIALGVCAGVTVVAAVLIALRWRRADGRERRQLAWLGVAGLVMAALFALGWIVMALLPGAPDIVGATIEALEIAVLPVAMLAAILDARLFDIDVVFRRSLVFGILTALVVGIYAGAIALATVVVGQSATVVGVLAASVVAAFALAPAKEWLARQVETRLYGSRRRHDEALALVGSRLGSAEPASRGDATLVAAAQALGESLRLGSVRIQPEDVPAAEWSSLDADRARLSAPVVLELVAFGAVEGRLIVTAGAGDALTGADVALLGRLAPQIALVTHAVRAAATLQRSRESIVSAREAERLRLRRDLHDGLGPALVGLALQADAIGPLTSSDPGRAAEASARVAAGLRGVIADVRSTVDGLRPADLDHLGLAGALAERARSLATGGVEVDVQCEVSGLSPATEVAAYRIATEAIANVVRHAHARSCLVRITAEPGALTVLVEDDGVGMADGIRSSGVGLDSMRARAEEIGGRLAISTGPAGTRVEAVLPVGAVQPQTAPEVQPSPAGALP